LLTKRGSIVAIAGVGAVLSGLLGYYTSYRTVSGTTAAGPSKVAPVNPVSVMVLPFKMISGEASRAYLADALTSSVTSDLSRIRDALVVPSAIAYNYGAARAVRAER
jgi:TolB-like protein